MELIFVFLRSERFVKASVGEGATGGERGREREREIFGGSPKNEKEVSSQVVKGGSLYQARKAFPP